MLIFQGLKKLFRYTIVIVLILSVSIGTMSSFFLDMVKMGIEADAKRSVAEKQGLRQLTLPLKNFMNRTDKDEVWDHGMLYDISSYIIINDSACVWVFHDQKEERLVNIIIGNYEQNDQYTPCNNTRHITKHHTVSPDVKILVAPNVITFAGINTKNSCTSSEFSTFSSQVHSGVIKPPPRLVVA